MSRSGNRSVREHAWVEYFDPVQDKACYNDGFNYVPIYEVCTKCGKKRRKKVYKKKSGGGLYTLGKYKIQDPKNPRSVAQAREQAKKRMQQVEFFKRKKGRRKRRR